MVKKGLARSLTTKAKVTITAATVGVIAIIGGLIVVLNNNADSPQDEQNASENQGNTQASYSGVEISDGDHSGDAVVNALAKIISEYHIKWENGVASEGSINRTGSFGEFFTQRYLREGMEAEGYEAIICDSAGFSKSYRPSYSVFWDTLSGKVEDSTLIRIFDATEYEKKKNNADYYGMKLILGDDDTVTISNVNFYKSEE